MKSDKKNFMTPKDLRSYIEELKILSDDDEMAHSAEDDLREMVLEEISRGNPFYFFPQWDYQRIADLLITN